MMNMRAQVAVCLLYRDNRLCRKKNNN